MRGNVFGSLALLILLASPVFALVPTIIENPEWLLAVELNRKLRSAGEGAMPSDQRGRFEATFARLDADHTRFLARGRSLAARIRSFNSSWCAHPTSEAHAGQCKAQADQLNDELNRHNSEVNAYWGSPEVARFNQELAQVLASHVSEVLARLRQIVADTIR